MVGSGFSRRPVLRVRLCYDDTTATSVLLVLPGPLHSVCLCQARRHCGARVRRIACAPTLPRAAQQRARARSAAAGLGVRATRLVVNVMESPACLRSLSRSRCHRSRALRSLARRSLALGAVHPRRRYCGAPRSQKLSLRLTPAAERGLIRCAARHRAAQQARARSAEGCQPTPPPLASSPTIAARAAPAARARRRRPQLWGASGASPRASDGAHALSGSRAALPSSTRRAS